LIKLEKEVEILSLRKELDMFSVESKQRVRDDFLASQAISN